MPTEQQDDLKNILEKTEEFKELLVDTATGGTLDSDKYQELRKKLLSVELLHGRLPDFVRSCRNASEYWGFIKKAHGTYQERRDFLRDAFNPLLNEIEDAIEGTTEITDQDVSSSELRSAKGSLRVFVSHSHKDRHQAAIIKEVLEEYGIEVFVAHEDITTSLEWESKILDYLRTTDLFVPILTKSFPKSKWADQETGIAYEKGAEFFPLIVDMTPYGFIGKYQGMKCVGGITHEHARKIIEELMANERIQSRVVDSLLSALEGSISFDQSNTIARQLRDIQDQLNSKRITAICKAWMENKQVREAYTARTFVYSLLRDRKDDIDLSLLPLLEKQVEEARSF